MQSAVHLAPLADEPGHPQEVVALLLALAFLLASRDVNESRGLEGLALIGAALLFTKINVGIFFGVALLLALGLHASTRFGRTPWRWIVMAGCTAIPFLLMRRHVINESWRNYAVVMAVSLITATLMSPEAPTTLVNVSRHRKVTIIFAVTVVALMALPIVTGTSVRGLAEGFVRGPLLTPAVATWPLRVSNAGLLSAAVSLVTCFFLWLNNDHPRRQFIVTSLKALVGTIGAIFLVSGADAQLKYLLPWVWLVLASGSNDREWEGTFSRVFLCLMAAWQGLQAYPIARTQVSIATFPMILVFTVCLWDAVIVMRMPERFREWFNGRRPGTVLRAAAGAALVCFFAIAWCKLPGVHSYYRGLPSLDLPGARLVRTDSETTQSYQKLAHYLNANSDTFLMCPGVNSFYFWASKEPPAYFNSTTLALLTERQLTQVLGALGRHEKRLILVSEDVPIDWLRDSSAPASLLARTLHSEYAATAHLSKFVIYAPKKLPEAAIGSR
jgi:hypothetical protein